MTNIFKFIIIGGIILYLFVGVLIFLFQERLIFLPEALEPNYQYAFDAPFKEYNITMNDGASLNALHFQVPEPKGLILYFHGNAGNLARWGEIVIPFTDYGYEVLVVDYRGYGKSNGKRSKSRMISDSDVLYNFALKIEKEDRLILYGRSLGSAFASHLAGKYAPARVILETPFYSLCDVAKDLLPMYPTTLLLDYNFKNYQSLKGVQSPVSIFHGTEDEVVPFESGRKLFESIDSSEKVLIKVEGGHHNDLSTYEVYWNSIEQILNDE